MRALEKARNMWRQTASVDREHRGKVPALFRPPVGGSTYYSRAYRYEQAYHYRYWAFVAIRAIINEIAGGDPPNLGWVKQKQDAGMKRVRKALGGPKEHEEFEPFPHDHPLQRVFRNPNGPDVAFDLWAYHTLFLELMGVSHWWIIRNDFGVPVEIWVIPPHWAQLMSDSSGMPAGYYVQSPWGYSRFVPFDDVVTFYSHSPLSRYEGWAASQAVSEWIDTYEAKTRMQLAVFKNGAIPAFHVQLGEAYADPDEQFLARFYSRWFNRFQGEDKSGLPLVTGPDIKIAGIEGHRPTEALFAAMQTEDQIRDMTLAAYNVPKGVVGVEPLNDTSAYAPQRAFCRFKINPMLKYMGEVIQEKVVKPTPGCEDCVAFWDDRIPNDVEMEERKLDADMKDGSLSPNEKRKIRGREPYPLGGNNPFVEREEQPWVDEVKEPQPPPFEEAAYGFDQARPRFSLNGNSGASGGYVVNGNGRKPQLGERP